MSGPPFSSVELYPEAQAEAKRPSWVVYATAQFAIFVLGVWVMAGFFYLDGKVEAGHLAVLFSLIMAAGSFLVVSSRLRRRGSTAVRLVQGPSGPHVEVPYSAAVYWGHGGVMSLLTVMAGWLVASRYLEVGKFADGAVIMLAVVFLVVATFPLAMALGRFARGRVELSPQGLYQRGWTFESYLPWGAVEFLHPLMRHGGPVIYVSGDTSRWRRRQLLPGWTRWWDKVPKTFQLAIPAKDLAVDGGLLYRMLCHYHLNRDALAELGTQEAVDKAHADAFPRPRFDLGEG